MKLYLKMRRFLTALFFLSAVLTAKGQQRWALEDCIRYAVSNNLEIKKSKLEADKADQNYRQSIWNMMPAIGASSTAGYNFGRTVVEGDLVSQSYFYNSYNLSASMELFNGFSRQNQISYYKFKKYAARNSEYSVSDNLAFEVMNYYYDVIYYEELLRIAREQKKLSGIIETKTEAYVKTGLKAQADLLEVKADLEKEELVCIQTENKLLSTWINLKKAMNINPDSTMLLTGCSGSITQGDTANLNVRTIYDNYISWAPRVKTYEYESKAGRKNISIQRSGFFPYLETGISLGTYFYPTAGNKDFNYQIKANQNQYTGLSLNIPIFSRNKNITSIRIAKLDYESAKTGLEQTKQDLLYEVITNYNDFKASLSEFSQAKKQLEADTLAYQAAEKKYDQGMINVVDFYTAKNRMTVTEGQVLHSRLTAEIKKRVIDFYMGNRFWEK